MINSLPNSFKFKIGRVFPSEEICTAQRVDDNFITEYNGEYTTITKIFSYSEAIACVNEGFWALV